jgi:hypothetical protein
VTIIRLDARDYDLKCRPKIKERSDGFLTGETYENEIIIVI